MDTQNKSSFLFHIKTIEQALSLPEMFFSELLEMGIGPYKLEDDDIVCFTDADGRSMRVEYTKNGPVKTPSGI